MYIELEDAKAFMEVFIYNHHGSISIAQIKQKWDELIKQEPYSTLYTLLLSYDFELKDV